MNTMKKSGGQHRGSTTQVSELPPLFIHSSWRTSSTWLWGKFRDDPLNLCYYEIFNEALSTITQEQIVKTGPDAWESGHPGGAAYYLEFLPLVKPGGGIGGHNSSMPFKNFIPSGGVGGSLSEEEEQYIELLLSHAADLKKRPILTDTRTLGRIVGLKRRFAGRHLFLFRNLFHHWASYTAQAERGNAYFLWTTKGIIEENLHDPFLRSIHEMYSMDVADARNPNWFYAFLLLHLYLYTFAFDHADVVIDASRLAVDERYARKVNKALRRKAECDVSLNGARRNIEFTYVLPADSAELRQTLYQATNTISGHLRPSKRASTFLGALLDDFFEELDRYRFYAGALTRVLVRNGGLLDERKELSILKEQQLEVQQNRDYSANRIAHLEVERDACLSELNHLRNECATLRENADIAAMECARLRVGQQVAQEERVELSEGLVQLQSDYDALVLVRDGLEREREALSDGLSLTSTQRDELVINLNSANEQLAHAAAEHDKLATKHDSLERERSALANQLLVERSSFEREKEALSTSLSLAKKSNDELLTERDRLETEKFALVDERNELLEIRNVLRNRLDQESETQERLLAEKGVLADRYGSVARQLAQVSEEREALAARCEIAWSHLAQFKIEFEKSKLDWLECTTQLEAAVREQEALILERDLFKAQLSNFTARQFLVPIVQSRPRRLMTILARILGSPKSL
jgi:hypothetical protein